jgi:KDO2-lipid IV(A) lauroyltransferase
LAGIGLLWLVVQLPYPLIYRLGTGLGRLAMRLMKRRAKIANRNLELCFPIRASKSVTAWWWQTLNPSAWG